MKKNIYIIIGILLGISLLVGITYAWITSVVGESTISGTTRCFDILYTKGKDIGSDQNKATLMPSNDYTGGLSSTILMSISNKCNVSATGKIYLTTSSKTSSNLYREGLLNYQVLKDGQVTDLKGSITSAGTITIDVGSLTKASSSSSATKYQVYVWVDYNEVANSDAYSSYYGSVSAKVNQVEG